MPAWQRLDEPRPRVCCQLRDPLSGNMGLLRSPVARPKHEPACLLRMSHPSILLIARTSSHHAARCIAAFTLALSPPFMLAACTRQPVAVRQPAISQRADDKLHASLRFDVTVAPGLLSRPEDGRLFVVMGKPDSREPRTSIGQAGADAPAVVARDVLGFASGKTEALDDARISYPIDNLSKLPPGDYSVQAVFHYNRDLN